MGKSNHKGSNNKDSRPKDDKRKDMNQKEINEDKREEIKESGQAVLDQNGGQYKIQLITIIGEIEGHDILGSNVKTTKYEHILPKIAAIHDDQSIDGVLVLLHTMGGDVEAGLAIAEMLASVGKPTVSLVLGGSHSIGIPIAVSTDYSFIVPTGTMVVHPVRMSGTVIGAPQTYDYFRQMQNRISTFVANHSNINKDRFEELLMETGILTKDVGTILEGEEAVEEGIINKVGGLKEAVKELKRRIDKYR
ncbi:MAG: ClpP family protease [Lachnospiraceae bacterium]